MSEPSWALAYLSLSGVSFWEEVVATFAEIKSVNLLILGSQAEVKCAKSRHKYIKWPPEYRALKNQLASAVVRAKNNLGAYD